MPTSPTVPDPAWVWGVDVAAARLDFAFIRRDGAYQINPLIVDKKLKPAARLAALFHNTRMFAAAMGHHCPPLIVYVERPTGRFPNPALDHACGIAQAAIYEALSSIYPFPVDVVLVPIGSWKLAVLGNGAATKEQIAAWAAERGYGGVQDGADALGVGACAAIECNFGPGPLHVIHSEPREELVA